MRVTKQQLIDAAKKNGFTHARNRWFLDENLRAYDPSDKVGSKDAPIIEACFMGQMAINLGVDASSLHTALNTHFSHLGSNIISWNDSFEYDYDHIEQLFEKRLNEYGPVTLNLRKATYIAKRKDEK